MQDQIYSLLMKEDEITWQTIIYNLVKSEEMNPWDIDISLLTKKYIETIKALEKMDFFLSGKVLLASAILLKIKSDKLVGEDIENFDNYLFHSDDIEDLTDFVPLEKMRINAPPLAIKTPQARKRRVTVYDLIKALEKALEVNKRRILRREAELSILPPPIPIKKINISELIKSVYEKIRMLFVKNEKVTFSKLVPSPEKKDKILTFLPLLHLDTQQKISMSQQEAFGEIEINLLNQA